MKKKIACLLPLLLVPFLASCQKEEGKVTLTYGTYVPTTVYTIKELTSVELNIKAKEEKEVFLLAVYQGEFSQDCLCWTTFENVIAKYMNTYHELVYIFDGQIQDGSLQPLKIDKYDESAPSLYVFNGDKNVAKFTYQKSQDKAIFEDTSGEAMYTRLHKVIDKPTMYYVDYDYLDTNYSKIEKMGVLFMRSGCSDCKYVIPNVILPYVRKKPLATNIYLFDMQKFYDQAKSEFATEEEKNRYFDIKDRFGLSEKGNATFGYQGGVVPTLHFVENGQIKGATIYFNESITKKEDGSFYISKSFYSEERLPNLEYLKDFSKTKVLQGMTVSKDDVVTYNGTHYWTQAAASKYHKPLLEAFLEHYLY